jgi:UDP-N-acetylmuramoyl-tripeptide--D-alanyl-D-alanine ligase
MSYKLEIKDLYSIYIEHPTISIDSRKIENGVLYFALKGDRFDGNSFAAKALADGASYAIIDNKDYFIDHRTVLVDNVLSSLQKLANYHIRQLRIPVLAITGTNGKTTTKELIRAVLSEKYNVLSTTGNLNNHIGVPLTILSITSDHNFAVIEMGANHPYEIEQLCAIAEPGFGLITNIGKAHLEGFGSFEGVIKTKKELYDFIIERNGAIFYNSDNPILNKLLENAGTAKISYGSLSGEYCKGNVVTTDPYVSVKATFCSERSVLEINTHIIGSYNLENILAAITIGSYFKVPGQNIKKALENYIPVNNRSQLTKTQKNALILDCYNANPSSTDVALKNLLSMSGIHKIAILGDMLELGTESEKEHRNILNFLTTNNIEAILTGPVYQKMASEYGFRAFENSDLLYDWLKLNPISGYLILIKGSRGIKLEKVIELL